MCFLVFSKDSDEQSLGGTSKRVFWLTHGLHPDSCAPKVAKNCLKLLEIERRCLNFPEIALDFPEIA